MIIKQWNQITECKVSIRKLLNIDDSWNLIFDKLLTDKKVEELERVLSEDISNNLSIYPPPNLLFEAFRLCALNKIKVVMIGQDPYFSEGQAMGLSFSVPDGIKIPSSLSNIFTNMKKFNHLKSIPICGNLAKWAYEGCLMLNSALTVRSEAINKGSHLKIWKWMTDSIISYISSETTNIVFVLWGNDAYKKFKLIDSTKHHIIVSSHPSGLSAYRPMGKFPAFMLYDHFGEINKYLEQNNKSKIVWSVND